MKRYRVVKDFLLCLKDNDVAIFSGKDLSREAFQYDRKGNFYISDAPGLASSLAIGMAMNTDKRIFVFCGDGDFMLELGAAAQMAVSKCENIFYVVFDNGCYQASGCQPTIFRELASIMGVIFNFGFVTHKFTKHFEKKISVSKMSKTIANLRGPSAIIIEVDKGYKKGLRDVSYSKVELKNNISDFIRNRELGTSLFVPPIPFGELDIDLVGGVN